jgi:hypothetical protein
MKIPINLIMILCDNCKKGFLLFDDPNVYAKEGFKAVKVLGAWRDFCSDECMKEFKTTEMRG